jgi:hypothetical protein
MSSVDSNELSAYNHSYQGFRCVKATVLAME